MKSASTDRIWANKYSQKIDKLVVHDAWIGLFLYDIYIYKKLQLSENNWMNQFFTGQKWQDTLNLKMTDRQN